ncbi:MAG TPA: O-antigen ligase family protein [Thermoanaerobaculia bacterium]|nr:O-antigen ligase family protein [Thermoanaerobaculia bacterium]
MRAAAVLLLAVLALATIWLGRQHWLTLRGRWLVFPIAVVTWTLFSYAFARNYLLGAHSLLDVAAAAVIFIFMVVTARRRSLAVFAALFIPALLNALVLLLQELHLWEPFTYTVQLPERLRRTGYIGNPDDVGMYFAPIAIAAVAVLLSARGWLRALATATAIAAIAAISISQTLTAFAALAAGLATLALVALRRKAPIALAVLIVLAGVGLMTTPAGYRIREMGRQVGRGHFPPTLAGRAVATLTAVEMFEDAPLLGVGPGGFAWEYFPYRLKVDDRWPELRGLAQENFGEAHNDHAQLLAETGLPGYLIFLAALIALGAVSFRDGGDERSHFARLVSLPAAVTVFVLALALFPLHIAAARMVLLFIAATVTAWRLD